MLADLPPSFHAPSTWYADVATPHAILLLSATGHSSGASGNAFDSRESIFDTTPPCPEYKNSSPATSSSAPATRIAKGLSLGRPSPFLRFLDLLSSGKELTYDSLGDPTAWPLIADPPGPPIVGNQLGNSHDGWDPKPFNA
eukprot:GHRR01030990.1.p1 GENE.GHRR01030990.1~~GHRR01030990.1.p1  ORF type:complete len:141 (-),score=23.18 GHRR01030990.1:473-895(-)